MLPDEKIGCHRCDFKVTCFDGVTKHKCQLWSHVIGIDPNTGQEIDYFACADVLRNKLIMEVGKEARQTGAAVESFRNVMVKGNVALLEHMEANGHRPLKPLQIEGDKDG